MREKIPSSKGVQIHHEEELTHDEIKRRAVGGVAAIFIRQGFMRAIGFVSTLILARLLNPEAFGIFAVTQFVLTFFNQMSLNGITAALVRRKGALSAADLGTGFLLQQALSLVSVLLILCIAPLVVRHYALPDEDVWLFRAITLALFFLSFKTIPTVILQRRLRFDLVALADILEQLIYVAAAAVMAYLKMGVWALVAATCLRGAVGAFLLALMGGWKVSLRFDRGIARDILRFALPMQAVNLVNLAYQGVVPLLLAPMFGATVTGITSTARTLIEAVTLQPLTMISGIQFRLMARVQDDAAQMRKLMESFIFLTGAFCFPMVGGLVVYAGRWAPALLSSKWASMVPIFQALGIAYLFRAAPLPYSQALKALGRTRMQVIAAIVAAALLAGVFLVAAPLLGPLAYALATAVADGAYLLLLAAALHDIVPARSLLSLAGPAIAATASVAIWIPAVNWTMASLPTIGLFLIGSIAYPAILILLDGGRVADHVRLVAGALEGRSGRLSKLAFGAAMWIESITLK